MAKITVQNTNITIITVNGDDYISLTEFKPTEFEGFRQQAIHQMSVLESGDNDRKLLK